MFTIMFSVYIWTCNNINWVIKIIAVCFKHINAYISIDVTCFIGRWLVWIQL